MRRQPSHRAPTAHNLDEPRTDIEMMRCRSVDYREHVNGSNEAIRKSREAIDRSDDLIGKSERLTGPGLS